MAAILSITFLLATSALAHQFYPHHVVRQASASASASGSSPASQPPVVTPAPTAATPPAASILPLTEYHYTYPNLPYQVNPYPSGRGPQSGYNICNSTTEGPNSLCQTAWLNSIDDFCLWGSPTANGQIGDVEASVVAYCTKHGHGTRLMPAGTLKSVQFMRTSAYIQVSGQLNQPGIGLTSADSGGELDPHGADLAGNPLGGLVFSNSLPTAKGTITQGENWSLFVGSGLFCFKVCDNTIRSPDYCQNIFDLIGCVYNMPSNAYTTTEFTDCQGDLQMEPGVYVSNGHTITWSQPASLSPSNTMPWQPSIPPSSSCTTYTSAKLFSEQSDGVTSANSHAPTNAASQTGSGARATSTNTSGAMSITVRWGGLIVAVAAGFALLV